MESTTVSNWLLHFTGVRLDKSGSAEQEPSEVKRDAKAAIEPYTVIVAIKMQQSQPYHSCMRTTHQQRLSTLL